MQMKLLLLPLLLLTSGCNQNSDDSTSPSTTSTQSYEFWDYIVADHSVVINFDQIVVTNSVETSLLKENFSHEYVYISDINVEGPFRENNRQYNYTKEGTINFIEIGKEALNNVSRFPLTIELNKTIYLGGGTGFANTSGGVSISSFEDAQDCILTAIHDTITLYDGYSYSNVMEISCEGTITQTYADEETSEITFNGMQRYKEYYQKGTGWIGRIDRDCISQTLGNMNIIDDSNLTCNTTSEVYKLAAF